MTTKIVRNLVMFLCFFCGYTSALEVLDDESLSQVKGQASLFTTDYVAPVAGVNGGNVGFYRLGLEAEISINTNIRSLKVGCDAADICDINLNNVRLTGLAGTSANDSGPGTDFVLTRPFFEFAIRNPDTAATREVLGIRFGAAEAIGRMTIGDNPNPSDSSDDVGITSFSGDMNAQIVNAQISNICTYLIGGIGNCDNAEASGSAAADCSADLLGGLFGCVATTATLEDYDYAAKHGGTPLIFKRSQVTGCGSTDFPSQKNCMFFDGLVAHASLLGMVLPSRMTEGLNFIHDLGVEDGTGAAVKDLSMSLQKEAITWQKVSTGTFAGATPAQAGWWISIPNVVVRDLVVNDLIKVDGLAAVGGSPVILSNLDLGQLPADNCYGSKTFC